MSKLNILIIADYLPGDATVIRDHLFSFDRYSNHRVFHLFWPSKHKSEIDFSHFDVIVIHWCIYITKLGISHPSIPASMVEKIRQAPAIKVLFLQDEYRRMNAVHEAMNELGINLMMTCAGEENREQLYPSRKLPSVDGLHTVLTGYVPGYLKSRSDRVKDDRPRSVDIGYRSRRLPFSLGKLGYEKTQVYEHVDVRAKQLGIRTNLSIAESERLYGADWHSFLSSSYCQLGTPSGASVIDFTGDIEKEVKTYVELRPFAPFDDVYETFLSDVDGKLVIDTISPRVFEYTAHGCIMLMTEGYYGGFLDPDRHYIPIKKDFSNLDSALTAAMDPGNRARLLANTRRDLIDNDRFSYKSFVEWFNQLLISEQEFVARGRKRQHSTPFHLKQALSQQHPSLPIRGREILIPWHVLHAFQQRTARWAAAHPRTSHALTIIMLLFRSPRRFLTQLGAELAQRFPRAHNMYLALAMFVREPGRFLTQFVAKLARRFPRVHPRVHYLYGALSMLLREPRRFVSRLQAKFCKH